MARATWAKAHDGAECPDNRVPTTADLAAWLAERECPEADELLGALYGAPAAWGTTTTSVACAYAADDEPLELCAAVYATGEPRRLQSLRLPGDEMDGPTLPADVWNMQLAEAEKRGPGLPAALRIFLASIVARAVVGPRQ